ncbi:hypothetical protein Ac2012v2_003711 [Leucoagaricus gongylophorus]
MAKSTRSKVKRSFRSKKRESGIYAATEAARLQRLNQKLQHAMEKDQDGDQDGDIKIGSTQENPEDPVIDDSDYYQPMLFPHPTSTCPTQIPCKWTLNHDQSAYQRMELATRGEKNGGSQRVWSLVLPGMG